MDLTPIIFGGDDVVWHHRKLVSLWFGLAMIAMAYFIDKRSQSDFAFWVYLFGTIAFWGGLSLMKSDSELSKFLYFLINLLLIAASVFLRRKVFIVFGAAGAFGYIGHLASDIFKDSILFPFALTLAGIVVLLLGIFLHKRGSEIEARFNAGLPDWMKRLRPAVRP